MAKVSFKADSPAKAARGEIAERIKAGDIKTDTKQPFALATHIVQGMSRGKRKAVAARR